MHKEDIEAIYPLSPVQQGMLFHSNFSRNSSVYVEGLHFQLHGALNIAAFKHAWQQVTESHAALRTFFVWKNREKPLQIVRRRVELPWREYDWSHISATEQQKQLQILLENEREQGFDLSKAPLMRITLVWYSPADYRFIWINHHIVLDGWSASMLLEEVFAIYLAKCRNEQMSLEQPKPYKEYIAWLQKQDVSQAEPYWRNLLKGFTTPTPIGTIKTSDHPPDSADTYKEQNIRLSEGPQPGVASIGATASTYPEHIGAGGMGIIAGPLQR